jgi:hypothetical protein
MAKGTLHRIDDDAGREGGEDETLVAYCSRPKCRREFRRSFRPGRPAAFCSDACRRTAEREYRQAVSRLENYESVVEQLRIDVAAFGKPADAAEAGGPITPDMMRRARDGVQQAAGAVPFLRGSDEPAARQLCLLFDAVAPVVWR